jgi:hypothetical protein
VGLTTSESLSAFDEVVLRKGLAWELNAVMMQQENRGGDSEEDQMIEKGCEEIDTEKTTISRINDRETYELMIR